MDWIEVTVKTTGEAVEAVADILLSFGAGGVAIDDPGDIILKDNRLAVWDYIDQSLLKEDCSVYVKAYFPEDRKADTIVDQIKSSVHNLKQYVDTGEGAITLKKVNDRDWENEWKNYYKPMRIGKNILIKPTWEKTEVGKDDVLIELDPGMAFGTGTHESTRMCIELMENYLKPGQELLDIGCGSGILSITAAKLGCMKVLGIDIDPVAVKVSHENIGINKVEGIVNVREAVLDDLECKEFDMVVANIVADVIIDISGRVRQFLTKDGIYIVSGIIRDRAEEVRENLTNCGFRMVEEKSSGEWVAMALQ